MGYQHCWTDGQPIGLPLGKIVCVGRNYAEHARELNNPVPAEPLLFMKPASSAVGIQQPIVIPVHRGAVHFETEITVLIGNANGSSAPTIAGIGLGLDLTLRDLQSELKANGHPWEKAKAFDGSAVLTPFERPQTLGSLESLQFQCEINEQRRQDGESADMLVGIEALLVLIQNWFSLQPGDVVFTGTPKGVGALADGDSIRLHLAHRHSWKTRVKSR